jgi:hypothetical protein
MRHDLSQFYQMKKETEQKQIILQKLSIIRSAMEVAAHKVANEKLDTAAKWLVQINEQTKELTKYCEKELK